MENFFLQKREDTFQFPVKKYLNPELEGSNALLPATIPAFLATGVLPKEAANFSALIKQESPFIIMSPNAIEKRRISDALYRLLQNLDSIRFWELLWESCGGLPGHGGAAGPAELYVVDRRDQRYQVIDVQPDYGGESGLLILRHIGPRSRGGSTLNISLPEDAYSTIRRESGLIRIPYMLPVVLYK